MHDTGRHRTREAVRNDPFAYIETFDNREPRHRHPGNFSPDDFERQSAGSFWTGHQTGAGSYPRQRSRNCRTRELIAIAVCQRGFNFVLADLKPHHQILERFARVQVGTKMLPQFGPVGVAVVLRSQSRDSGFKCAV